VVLGVEELLAEDVCAELLGLDDRDRFDLRGALELEPVAAGAQLGGDVTERALERRDAVVQDREAKHRVDPVGDVGPL
jgi:hypothetical protein